MIDMPELPKQEASAEFLVLFSTGKVETVTFVSGCDSLKDAAPLLQKSKFDLRFPDNGPEKIVRRGALSCSTYTSPSCQFVLFLPETIKR